MLERPEDVSMFEACGNIHPKAETRLANGLALIFDMDGVLINSNPLHRETWRIYNLQFGIKTDEAMQQRMYGKRNDEIVRDFFGSHLSDAEVKAHGAAKERLYRSMMASSLDKSLVPGVRRFLERHKDSPIGIATNAEPPNVDFLLDNAWLRHYFRVVVDGHQVQNPKPHPETYCRAADLLGVAPGNCIVFEDSFPGIEAARTAGMRIVAVKTTHPELPGADLAIENFLSAELEPWLVVQKPSA